MATVVRELVATFALDVDEKSFGKAEKSIDQVIGAARILGGLFVTGVVAKGFATLIDLASDVTENLNVVSTVFGDSTDIILDWARQTSSAVGRSEFDLRRFVGTAQAMLAPMLGSADAASRMSTRVVELAIDMGSFFNIADEEAFRKLQAGISGEIEPLKRLGIVMTQDALNAFALAQGFDQTVNNMTEAQKTTLRLNFIFDRLSFLQDDAANTANDFANVQRTIGLVAKDVATRLGQFLLPAITKSAIATRDIIISLRDWIDANKEFLQQAIGGTFGNLLQVIDNTSRGLRQAAGFAINLFDKLSPLQKGIIGVTVAIIALIAVMSLPFAPIIALIALIGLIIDDLVVFGDGGKSVFGDLLKSVTGFADGAGLSLDGFFQFFADAWSFITSTAKIAWDFISGFFTSGADDAGEESTNILGSFMAAWESLKNVTQTVMDFIVDIFDKGFAIVSDFLKDVFSFDVDEAVSDFKEVIDKVREFLADLLQNPLVKALIATLGVKFGAQLGTFVGKEIGGLIEDLLPKGKAGRAVEKLLGFNPAKVIGEAVGGVVGGVTGAVAGGALGFQGAGVLGGALRPELTAGQTLQDLGGSVIDQSSTEFNITQLAGESGEQLAQRIVGLVTESRDKENRAIQESFVPATP